MLTVPLTTQFPSHITFEQLLESLSALNESNSGTNTAAAAEKKPQTFTGHQRLLNQLATDSMRASPRFQQQQQPQATSHMGETSNLMQQKTPDVPAAIQQHYRDENLNFRGSAAPENGQNAFPMGASRHTEPGCKSGDLHFSHMSRQESSVASASPASMEKGPNRAPAQDNLDLDMEDSGR